MKAMSDESDADKVARIKLAMALSTDLGAKLNEVINKWIRERAEKKDLSTKDSMLLIYQVVAYQLGYVDTISINLGATTELRTKIAEYFINVGSRAAEQSIQQKTKTAQPVVPKDGLLN
jgi:hypothetical protein